MKKSHLALVLGIILLASTISLYVFIFTFLLSFFRNFPLQTFNTQTRINKMTLEQKVGQLLFIGLDPDSWEESLKMSNLAGGILINEKLAEKNIGDVTEQLASPGGIIPFIGIDQEGGPVCRLSFLDCTGQKEITDSQKAFDIAYQRGQDLKNLGINVVFAPVLDISTDSADFIWPRTFASGSETEVGNWGASMIKGFKNSGVLACPKHFPGHGGTVSDSHQNLPVMDCDEVCLAKRLLPFKLALEAGSEMIMVGHIKLNLKTNEKTDDLPASMSEYMISDVLRKQLKFKGIVIADDLFMRALSQADYQDSNLDKTQDYWWVPEAAVEAIKAGVDMVILSDKPEIQEKTFARLVRAVETGEISEKKLDESIKRILKVKRLLTGDVTGKSFL